jgi:hypothetical protein
VNEHERINELLPLFASGGLGEDEAAAVARHVASCQVCRADLALWRQVGMIVNGQEEALPVPPAAVLGAVLAEVASPASAWSWAWQLLRAQVPLLEKAIWPASLLVIALGFVIALFGRGGAEVGFLEVLAPLVAAAGIATVYGSENDPSLELALATPTSPLRVLLARVTLVFGFDLVVGLMASVALLFVSPSLLLNEVVMSWLAPMTFLSALALLLSVRLGSGGAVAVASLLWLSHWLARGVTTHAVVLGGTTPSLAWLGELYNRGWAEPALLFGLAALLTALTVWQVGRQEYCLGGDSLPG